MKTPEIQLLDRPEVEVPEEEVCGLQEKCISLLERYGKGIMTKSASFEVSWGKGEIQLRISANNRKPSKTSIIRIKPEGHICELVLIKQDQENHAVIFDDWGMGDRLDEVVYNDEYVQLDAGQDTIRSYTNPRTASKDEFQSYRIAIDRILSSNPLN